MGTAAAPGHTLPLGFDRVGEALVSERGVAQACADAGRGLADDGVPLVEALGALLETATTTTGREPAYDAITALAAGWSDATLSYLHQLSCEDPLSGLATLAHLRARLGELHRAHQHTDPAAAARDLCLVVLELVRRSESSLDTALRVARVAGLARTVWPGEETITRAARSRVLVLVGLDDRLHRRTRLVRTLVGPDLERMWVEGVPRTEAAAADLLDELARG